MNPDIRRIADDCIKTTRFEAVAEAIGLGAPVEGVEALEFFLGKFLFVGNVGGDEGIPAADVPTDIDDTSRTMRR